MRRIAVLMVGVVIASMSLLASPAKAEEVCTGGKYNVCVSTEGGYCFENVNNAWRAFFGYDLIVCH